MPPLSSNGSVTRSRHAALASSRTRSDTLPSFGLLATAARITKFASVNQSATSPGFWVSSVASPVARFTRYMSNTFLSRWLRPTSISFGWVGSRGRFCARTPSKGVRSFTSSVAPRPTR